MSFLPYTCAIFSHVTEYCTLTIESPGLSAKLHSVTSKRSTILFLSLLNSLLAVLVIYSEAINFSFFHIFQSVHYDTIVTV
jgi:hypothetical protein